MVSVKMHLVYSTIISLRICVIDRLYHIIERLKKMSDDAFNRGDVNNRSTGSESHDSITPDALRAEYKRNCHDGALI